MKKKLIEVALPLEAINKESAREKSIRHGHPSTLHLWWARRPLAACRAVLFAQLVDDPSSRPDEFPTEEEQDRERKRLFRIIEELVKWENTNNQTVIDAARAEIARCVAFRKIETGELQRDTIIFGNNEGQDHSNGPLPNDKRYTAWQVNCRQAPPAAVNHFLAEYAPPVLDPFAGGGSIPLEAQRLGLRAHASDLNPVAVLINKALIEIPPKFAGMPPVNPEWQEKSSEEKTLNDSWRGAAGLADDVRYYGQWMRDQAEKRIGHLYPKVLITEDMAKDRPDLKPYVGQELTVIAWLWARTVKSSNPAVPDVEVPLISSFWLSKKKGKEAWVEPLLDRENNTYRFEVRTGIPKFADQIDTGTKIGRGCKFRCIMSDEPITDTYVKEKGMTGAMGCKLMAIVAEGNSGRVYLSPDAMHEKCGKTVTSLKIDEIKAPIALDKRAIWCLLYGLDTFDKLFTPRQLTALTTFSDLVSEARDQVLQDATAAGTLPDDNRPLAEGGIGPQAYADAVATYLAFGLSRASDYWSGNATWEPGGQFIGHTFTKQALPMVWDFAESNPFSEGSGNWDQTCISWIVRVIDNGVPGAVSFSKQSSAVSPESYNGEIVSTDPPYYDNIGYADLSDYFYIWLRRSLQIVYPGLLNTMLTPKTEELIASPYRHNGDKAKAAAFFEKGLGRAIGQWRRHGHGDYPTTIFYAFKQAETDTSGTASTGWETFLSGVINQGFAITATWPLRTERSVRSVAIGTNALASSVVLACVPRPADAPMATRREFLNALKRELPDALRLLQSGNIAPVDLAQAAIGPGMALFSRYAKVIEADGASMTVRTALTLINQMLDEVLAEQEGEFDAYTRWAVAWFEQYGVQEGPYGVAETLSKAKNTSVQGLAESGIVNSRAGSVQLLGRNDLPADWDPAKEKHLTAWEATQQLIQALDTKGESGAADLLRQLGGDYGDKARDLAYRLYSICERKKWAHEALAYNSLVVAWPELIRLANQTAPEGQSQGDLF